MQELCKELKQSVEGKRNELKQLADYVTTSVDEDGILNALQHFNVI